VEGSLNQNYMLTIVREGCLTDERICFRNIVGMPLGPPLVLIFSRLIARSTNDEVNFILSNLLWTCRSKVDEMVPLSSVNLLVKTLCSNSALIDESLVIVPLLFFEAPIADFKLNLLLVKLVSMQ